MIRLQIMTAEMIEVEASKLDDTLANIQIKYHTCLRRAVPKGKHVTRYDCHRAGVPQRVVRCSPLRKGSKRSGCSFHLNIRVNEGINMGSLAFMYTDVIQVMSQERDLTCTTCRSILM